MKKIFCDYCGEEMDYGKMPAILHNSATVAVLKSLPGIKPLRAMVRIHIDFDKESGKHADVCQNCRVAVIETALNSIDSNKV